MLRKPAEQQFFYFKLLYDDGVSHSICKGEPSHPTAEVSFCNLCPNPYSFSHDPYLMGLVDSRTFGKPWTRKYVPDIRRSHFSTSLETYYSVYKQKVLTISCNSDLGDLWLLSTIAELLRCKKCGFYGPHFALSSMELRNGS